ncbi:MAG TPA: hypothetical protein VKF36_18025 [Syntrophorhabdales bacterium]|nr:hypothetical protein [Syntrophorhabdales bacterium]
MRNSMLVLSLSTVFSIFSAIWSFGDSENQHVRRTGSVQYNIPACVFPNKNDMEQLHLVAPTVGLFIGVSEYEENGKKAGVLPTVAHALSASLFQSPFYQAAFFHSSNTREIWLQDSDQEGEFKWQSSVYGMSYLTKRYLHKPYRLKTIADARLDLGKPAHLGAFRIMGQIPGIRYNLPDLFKEGIVQAESIFYSPDIGEYAEIGEGHKNPNSIDFVLRKRGVAEDGETRKPVSKARILSNIANAINEAQDSFEWNGRVLLIIYISAHGRLGNDGQPYILPYDAVAEDPKTWIAYRDIIEKVRSFLQKAGRQEMNKHAVVVLDTCQTQSPNKHLLQAIDLPVPPGMTLVQSASPGQYAWHWQGQFIEGEYVEMEKEGLGMPAPPSQKHLQRTPSAFMSVLPLSSTCAMNTALSVANTQKVPIGMVINTYQWFDRTCDLAQGFLDRIPLRKERGLSQDTTILYGSAIDRLLPVFVVMPKAVEKE